jgi:hypothetical protein
MRSITSVHMWEPICHDHLADAVALFAVSLLDGLLSYRNMTGALPRFT